MIKNLLKILLKIKNARLKKYNKFIIKPDNKTKYKITKKKHYDSQSHV